MSDRVLVRRKLASRLFILGSVFMGLFAAAPILWVLKLWWTWWSF